MQELRFPPKRAATLATTSGVALRRAPLALRRAPPTVGDVTPATAITRSNSSRALVVSGCSDPDDLTRTQYGPAQLYIWPQFGSDEVAKTWLS